MKVWRSNDAESEGGDMGRCTVEGRGLGVGRCRCRCRKV